MTVPDRLVHGRVQQRPGRVERVAGLLVPLQESLDPQTQLRIAGASLVQEGRPLGGVFFFQGLDENALFSHEVAPVSLFHATFADAMRTKCARNAHKIYAWSSPISSRSQARA